MGKLLEAVARIRQDVKLSRGQCENMECRKPLRDDAKRVNGVRVCSPECDDKVWASSY